MTDWQSLAAPLWEANEWHRLIELYQRAIAAEPEQLSHYWQLGIVQLIVGEELSGQETWFAAIADRETTEAELEQWNQELAGAIAIASRELEQKDLLSQAWLLRRHLYELMPQDLENLLRLMVLRIREELCTAEEVEELGILEHLASGIDTPVAMEVILATIKALFDCPPLYDLLPQLLNALAAYASDAKAYLETIIRQAVSLGYWSSHTRVALAALEVCHEQAPEELEVYVHMVPLYQNIGEFAKSIAYGLEYRQKAQELPEQLMANYLLMRAYLGSGGHWAAAIPVLEEQEQLIAALLDLAPTDLPQYVTARMYLYDALAPYIADDPRRNHRVQQQLSQLCQKNVATYARTYIDKFQPRSPHPRPLRIGYASHCFRHHSVGWLARWVYEYHDRQNFQIFTYFVATPPIPDPLQQWYYDRSDGTYFPATKGSGEEIFRMAERIYDDKIDILIDLDSLTLDGSCELMALRAAPIQATWLGWDSSSVPTVDYFIADPYVLPDDAQDYYRETIWRLPQTYIAVEGFEAGVPSLRRDRLNIPSDAVVFYSAQKGYKRHPETVRRQMRILKSVPHSYFLIKGLSDQAGIREAFIDIANQEGVPGDRLRFLPPTASEEVHRADMAIADVILDTYPYNGATTTLEALWMGIPIVTQVGQQFFARYSYTMLKNAGISTGIATTADEYIAWGIRYGTDARLRQEVAWQLKQSRQTAPLWNAERFTRYLEAAYQEMWQRYVAST